MAVRPELRYDGYYFGGPSFVDTYSLLKLYPDGYWLYLDAFETQAEFESLLDSINIEELKRRWPDGHYERSESNSHWKYRFGRFKRVQAYCGQNDAGVPFTMNDALICTFRGEHDPSGYCWPESIEPDGGIQIWGLDTICYFVQYPTKQPEDNAVA